MSYNFDLSPAGDQQHAVICRDTLDGRISIEHQTLDGSRICQTEHVATVSPDEAVFHVQECEKALGLKDGASPLSSAKQTQFFACCK